MILDIERLAEWRAQQTGIVVASNGCFDLLHVGHSRYLRQAKALGDILIVGVNSDASTALLKGKDRPVQHQSDRAELLTELRCVDVAVIFNELRATRFLDLCRPNVWCKGGDYDLDSIAPEERVVLEKHHAKIVLLPLTVGKSTTLLLRVHGG